MEKSAKNINIKYTGLLILLFLGQNIFAQTLKYEGNNFYKGDTITFSATLQDIQPYRVSFFLGKLPDSIIHVSSKKSGIIIDKKRSTLISISFLFEASGEFQLPPLRVNVAGKDTFLPFDKITIKTKKEDLKAAVFWKIDVNPVRDEAFTVTLKAQNFKKLIEFKYDIPTNCIFEQIGETKTEFPVDDENPMFTEVDLAKFNWTIYDEASLPKVTVKVMGADDLTVDIVAEPIIVSPLQQTVSKPLPPIEEALFTEVEILTDSTSLQKEEEITALLDKLRLKKLIFHTITLIFVVISVVSIILAIVFIIQKKHQSLIFMGIFVLSITSIFLSFLQSRKEYGIIYDGEIFSVPDNTSTPVRGFMYGDEIEIKHRSGNWYLVEKNGISGWAEKKDIISIEDNP